MSRGYTESLDIYFCYSDMLHILLKANAAAMTNSYLKG